MNKTVKTIAWICLILGLLGVAVEVGLYVRGRSLVAQMQESIASGEYPPGWGRFGGLHEDEDFKGQRGDLEDTDGGGELHRMLLNRDGRFPFGGAMGGARGGVARGIFGRPAFGIIFLILAAGPVLMVIGAVTLVVNREPKMGEDKRKKSKSKKA